MERQRIRKIYIVPNLVTTANMFCGFYSVIAAIAGEFTIAAWWIIGAAVFDMLDGRIARLAKATSLFGVEYDSMSDLISFGMAPAVLLHQWALEPFGRLGWMASFLYLACAALRLARFNVMTAVIPKNYFQGLPSPMAAGVVATSVIFVHEYIDFDAMPKWIVVALAFALASLMVSTVRFPSFKEVHWRSRGSFGYLMVGILAIILIAARAELFLFLLLVAYILLSMLWNIVLLFKQAKCQRHPEHLQDVNATKYHEKP